MTRRIISLIATTAMVFALMPAFAASASALSTATLVDGIEVFPGDAQDYSIKVTNSEVRLIGKSIRFVSVTLPRAAGVLNSASDVEAPSGWTAQKFSAGSLEVIRFTGGSIAPGSDVTFPFKADVRNPLNGDMTGKFGVSVSDDADGTELRPSNVAVGGTLTTAIRTLQILDIAPVAPPLALKPHRDMTAGGEVDYAVTYQNLARNGQDVATEFTSNRNNDTITGTDTLTVPGEGEATAAYTIKLGGGNSDRDSTFTAGGEAERSIADPVSDVYRVLAPAQLQLDGDRFAPRNVRSENNPTQETFTIPASKVGTPGLELTSGTLEFATTTAQLQVPVDYERGSNQQELTFGPVDVTGAHGVHDATFTLSGTDDNGLPFDFKITLDDLINIDNIAPLINLADIVLPNDGDNRQQTEGKSGDEVEISGTIDDPDATFDFVELRSTAGDTIEIEVSRSGESFSGSAELDFPDAEGTDHHTFKVVAQARDKAGNIGFDTSAEEVFDDLAPLLRNPDTSGNGGSARTVVDPDYGSRPAIEIQFFENHNFLDGCSESLWEVAGQPFVSDVLYSNGQDCGNSTSDDPGDDIRILVLPTTIDRQATPTVEYTPRAVGSTGLTGRAKDGAGNYTVQTLIDTVVGIVPPLPEILDAVRNGGQETAVLDEEKYWTRFTGNDLELTLGRARPEYFVEVLDGDGNVLRTFESDGSEAGVFVPIGTDDGDYARGVRFVNTAGKGPVLDLTVALDRVDPAIGGSSRTGDEVDVTFSEKIWDGDQNAADFFVWEVDEDPDSDSGRFYYQVDRVDGDRSDTWTLTASTMQGAPFGGTDYAQFRQGDGVNRLEDRAGNTLANTLS